MLGVDGSLVGLGKKNNSLFQISHLEEGLQIVTFVANRLLAWYAAPKRGQGGLLSQTAAGKMPGAKRKAADPRLAELGGTVRKARRYGVFSRTSAEPGLPWTWGPTKKERVSHH
jgi:hypothetical protein